MYNKDNSLACYLTQLATAQFLNFWLLIMLGAFPKICAGVALAGTPSVMLINIDIYFLCCVINTKDNSLIYK